MSELFPMSHDEALLAQAMQRHMSANNDEPGLCVAVFRRGQISALVCCGLAGLPASGAPAIEADTAFRLASVSKQFTAAAVLILRRRGRLSLEDSVKRHLPQLPPWAATMTLRHLLTHTSGVWPYEDIIPAGRSTQLTDADVLELMAGENRTRFSAGEKFYYSNTGYALLANVVERASGCSFPSFLKEAIFDPLAMHNTLAYVAGGPPVQKRAYGCAFRDGRWQDADQGLTSAVLGDGGIYTTAPDYALWDASIYEETLLPRADWKEAFAYARDNQGRALPYGLGWRLEKVSDGREIVYHTGNTTGFNSCVRRLPVAGVAVLAMANRTGTQTHKITRDILAVL
ncbi:hypothetical protein CVU37_05775 [candidate division BRC1 bacterium HGW-BRC1-1]|jgi:CubicO group peptidase (beta-lactamase class C family)|nr:MAG: hypothetical protein CVU37_05775 [candidate division BRC1 bacterium HGW-BRC1-1]